MSHPARIAETCRRVEAGFPGTVARATDLVAAGLTRHQLVAAEEAGALMWLRRGVLVSTQVWVSVDDDARRRLAVRAAQIAYPDGVAALTTAARLHDLPVLGDEARMSLPAVGRAPGRRVPAIPVVRLAVPGQTRSEAWLRLHGLRIPEAHVGERHGLVVTGILRTAVDTAARSELPEAVAILDAAQRLLMARTRPQSDIRRLVRSPHARVAVARSLALVVDECGARRGSLIVRQAAALSDPASESVLESISRVRIVQAGIPAPSCGMPIRGWDGRLYWVDLLWEEQRVIGEADGLLKYADRDVLVREKRRQEALEDAGWMVVRWTWDESVVRPELLIARIRRAFARRAP